MQVINPSFTASRTGRLKPAKTQSGSNCSPRNISHVLKFAQNRGPLPCTAVSVFSKTTGERQLFAAVRYIYICIYNFFLKSCFHQGFHSTDFPWYSCSVSHAPPQYPGIFDAVTQRQRQRGCSRSSTAQIIQTRQDGSCFPCSWQGPL